ncbi:hypothetical protein FPZ49_13750 [Paenibacillus cremeus]|uniref:Uncharacterized protein n=1 Tax=Paenibacillus cremeus TaxID=2163881 RepID=A0A559KBJ1_9BACL|nr:hypothetical protein FPZ49_13750 [Paenibacillus cremeus]
MPPLFAEFIILLYFMPELLPLIGDLLIRTSLSMPAAKKINQYLTCESVAKGYTPHHSYN